MEGSREMTIYEKAKRVSECLERTKGICLYQVDDWIRDLAKHVINEEERAKDPIKVSQEEIDEGIFNFKVKENIDALFDRSDKDREKLRNHRKEIEDLKDQIKVEKHCQEEMSKVMLRNTKEIDSLRKDMETNEKELVKDTVEMLNDLTKRVVDVQIKQNKTDKYIEQALTSNSNTHNSYEDEFKRVNQDLRDINKALERGDTKFNSFEKFMNDLSKCVDEINKTVKADSASINDHRIDFLKLRDHLIKVTDNLGSVIGNTRMLNDDTLNMWRRYTSQDHPASLKYERYDQADDALNAQKTLPEKPSNIGVVEESTTGGEIKPKLTCGDQLEGMKRKIGFIDEVAPTKIHGARLTDIE